jgi:hypothetical protein
LNMLAHSKGVIGTYFISMNDEKKRKNRAKLLCSFQEDLQKRRQRTQSLGMCVRDRKC